jgi:hypothetical protein
MEPIAGAVEQPGVGVMKLKAELKPGKVIEEKPQIGVVIKVGVAVTVGMEVWVVVGVEVRPATGLMGKGLVQAHGARQSETPNNE